MYLPVRLQHSGSHAWQTLRESAQAAAGISGIFLTRVSPFRAMVSLCEPRVARALRHVGGDELSHTVLDSSRHAAGN
jgi:hypothetical protein